MKSIAYIDGQNLYYGISKCHDCSEKLNIKLHNMKVSDCLCGNAWTIDFKKFREYLRDKYKVEEAYYFLGYLCEENQNLYTKLQLDGFIVIFKEHNPKALSQKKGNVDVDLVFETMKKFKEEDFNLILISGDGDYKKLVDYFVSKGLLKKIIFPNIDQASGLYTRFGSEYYDHLSNPDLRAKLYLKN